jgi:hypothetical protein
MLRSATALLLLIAPCAVLVLPPALQLSLSVAELLLVLVGVVVLLLAAVLLLVLVGVVVLLLAAVLLLVLVGVAVLLLAAVTPIYRGSSGFNPSTSIMMLLPCPCHSAARVVALPLTGRPATAVHNTIAGSSTSSACVCSW